jgi:hypothetical protein
VIKWLDENQKLNSLKMVKAQGLPHVLPKLFRKQSGFLNTWGVEKNKMLFL